MTQPDNPFLWHPSNDTVDRANLTRFMKRYQVQSFDQLMQKSTQDVRWFTRSLLEYLNIQFYRPYSTILDDSRGPAWPVWCVGGTMNIVHNCLDRYTGTSQEDRIALVWESEAGDTGQLTYRQLRTRVNQMANGLRSLGLGKGDVIGLYMPMIPEIAISLLAIAKIGAIILPLFSGFGQGALVTRLAETEAKALITADGYTRRGKPVAMKDVADQAAREVPSLKHILFHRYIHLDTAIEPGRDVDMGDLLASQPDDAWTEETAAEDVLMVIYTSGTTGRPKGAVHTHCGFPIKAAQDMAFGTDVHSDERIYWVTDMGWMMGPWLVFGTLLLGATFVIYDGTVDYPGPDRLWNIVDRHRINVLGISPSLIRALIAHGDSPVAGHDLSSLRILASTGEPWNPEPWAWLFEKVGKSRLPIINYSGGTELSGGILMGNPLLPIKATGIPAPCPGMAADVFDENGNPVRGQVGELVIKAPWIGITRGFWKDPERHLDTFWSRWPGIWVHGDWALYDEDDQWFVLGRSDDTIKIAGKRLGPAEIESVAVEHPEVVEAAAIAIPDDVKGSAVIVFCVVCPEVKPSQKLSLEIKELITRMMGKALAPQDVIFVRDLPKTRNAKVMRRMVRAAFLGQDPGDTSALVNPESIGEIQALRQASVNVRVTGQ